MEHFDNIVDMIGLWFRCGVERKGHWDEPRCEA